MKLNKPKVKLIVDKANIQIKQEQIQQTLVQQTSNNDIGAEGDIKN